MTRPADAAVAAFLFSELPDTPEAFAAGTLLDALPAVVERIEGDTPAQRARRLAEQFPHMDCVLTDEGITWL